MRSPVARGVLIEGNMSALPMGWEKRQPPDQEVSPWERIGSWWDKYGSGSGAGGGMQTFPTAAGSAAQGAAGGGSGASIWDLFGGMYDSGPQLDYVPLGAGSAEAARKAGGLPEGEIVYTMV